MGSDDDSHDLKEGCLTSEALDTRDPLPLYTSDSEDKGYSSVFQTPGPPRTLDLEERVCKDFFVLTSHGRDEVGPIGTRTPDGLQNSDDRVQETQGPSPKEVGVAGPSP